MSSPRERLDQLFEASAGDIRDDGTEPVFISVRANCARKPAGDVVRFGVRVDERTMTARYEILDPTLTCEDVVTLFREIYLRAFTKDHWRTRVDTLVFESAKSGERRSHSYGV